MIYTFKKSAISKEKDTAGKAKEIEIKAAAPAASPITDPGVLPVPVPAASDADFRLSLESKDLLNAIILSEVLGKPKCMRRGR